MKRPMYFQHRHVRRRYLSPYHPPFPHQTGLDGLGCWASTRIRAGGSRPKLHGPLRRGQTQREMGLEADQNGTPLGHHPRRSHRRTHKEYIARIKVHVEGHADAWLPEVFPWLPSRIFLYFLGGIRGWWTDQTPTPVRTIVPANTPPRPHSGHTQMP